MTKQQLTSGLTLLALLLAGGVATTASPAGASAEATVKLRWATGTALWSGEVQHDEVSASRIAECAVVACDHVRLEITLGDRVWNRPGAVQVTARRESGESLRLHVYRNGAHLVSGTTSVGLVDAANGTYDVYVSASTTTRIAYEGLAQVEFDPKRHPARDLLPDIEARPPDRVTFDLLPPESCHASESAGNSDKICLRFDTNLSNVGEGALDLRFSRALETESVTQRIHSSLGELRTRSAGTAVRRDDHYRLAGFVRSALWATNQHGQKATDVALVTGGETDLCVRDTVPDRWALRGDDPSPDHVASDCGSPQGISRGWGDHHSWRVPGQYLDISSVPDGVYILETTLDAGEDVLEDDETNNTTVTCIRLNDTITDIPRVTVLGHTLPCVA